MNLEEAKKILTECFRDELVDHAFGDSEVSWFNSNNQHVAEGYYGVEVAEVVLLNTGTMFIEDEARSLREMGQLKKSYRNDEGQHRG